MLNLLRRDWVLFKTPVLLIMLLMAVLLLVQRIEPEGVMILGVMILMLPALMIFAQEDKSRGHLLNASLPGTRRQVFTLRFVSLWISSVAMIVFILLVARLNAGTNPELVFQFRTLVTAKLIFSYLWVSTIAFAVLIPLFLLTIGKGLYVLLSIGLGLNFLLGLVFFFSASSGGGPDIEAIFSTGMNFLYTAHSGGLKLLGSTLLLIISNAAIYGIGLRIYTHRDLD